MDRDRRDRLTTQEESLVEIVSSELQSRGLDSAMEVVGEGEKFIRIRVPSSKESPHLITIPIRKGEHPDQTNRVNQREVRERIRRVIEESRSD